MKLKLLNGEVEDITDVSEAHLEIVFSDGQRRSIDLSEIQGVWRTDIPYEDSVQTSDSSLFET